MEIGRERVEVGKRKREITIISVFAALNFSLFIPGHPFLYVCNTSLNALRCLNCIFFLFIKVASDDINFVYEIGAEII